MNTELETALYFRKSPPNLKNMRQRFKELKPVCALSKKVSPINSLEEGISRGNFAVVGDLITPTTVKLEPAEGDKLIHLVFFQGHIEESELMDLLVEFGKMPCRQVSNYFFGLLAAVTEQAMPDSLRDKRILALEFDNPNSWFKFPYQTEAGQEYFKSYFLHVERGTEFRSLPKPRGYRKLDLMRGEGMIFGEPHYCQGRVFLTEDLVLPE